MKPAEAKVLDGLRKTTLAYLSDKQYAEVVEAVEKQGILGLTGAASRLVKGAVVKHGSHDQKTHGRERWWRWWLAEVQALLAQVLVLRKKN
jgi:hypothetical protein